MSQDRDEIITRWMQNRFPDVDFTVREGEHHRAVVYELKNGKLVEGCRKWVWKWLVLRGWKKWEGPDQEGR